MAKEDTNRKTTVPVKDAPRIVEWLVNNCTPDELSFMASLAMDQVKFSNLLSIINRLIDYNMANVFYSKVTSEQELMTLRAGKLGEVAGLKAFYLSCKVAKEQLIKKQDK